MTYPSTEHVASVVKRFNNDHEVKVYEVVDNGHEPPHYYWCCDADGACGRHRSSKLTSLSEAHLHLSTHTQEVVHHGQA